MNDHVLVHFNVEAGRPARNDGVWTRVAVVKEIKEAGERQMDSKHIWWYPTGLF